MAGRLALEYIHPTAPISTSQAGDIRRSAPLDLVRLTPLMEVTRGRPDILVGVVDGPIALDHPDLTGEHIREVPGKGSATCIRADNAACIHGTYVTGILAARRNSVAPGICPDCTLVVRPIFVETTSANDVIPSSTSEQLAAAIVETIEAGVRVINLSAALAHPSTKGQRELEDALNYAASRRVILVVAAGNQGTIGSSAITGHPWVIPVIACDLRGMPLNQSNLGRSIGRLGLSAPGDRIISLGAVGGPLALVGTSAAAPFVTGTIALLWSEFPLASATEIKLALKHTTTTRRTTIVPPLLDACAAYQVMAQVR